MIYWKCLLTGRWYSGLYRFFVDLRVNAHEQNLDCLGRNMEEIKREWLEIQESCVGICVIDMMLLNIRAMNELRMKKATFYRAVNRMK